LKYMCRICRFAPVVVTDGAFPLVPDVGVFAVAYTSIGVVPSQPEYALMIAVAAILEPVWPIVNVPDSDPDAIFQNTYCWLFADPAIPTGPNSFVHPDGVVGVTDADVDTYWISSRSPAARPDGYGTAGDPAASVARVPAARNATATRRPPTGSWCRR
jgi:hypothetical protein